MTWLPPVLVAMPLAAAGLLVAGIDKLPRRFVELFAAAVSLAALAGALTVVRTVAAAHVPMVVWLGDWHPGNIVGLGIAFAADRASAAIAVLVATVVFAAIVFAHDYFDDVGTIFYVLLLAMLGAMLAFAFAADAFDLFVFYEVFSVAAYALSAYRIERKSAFSGALQFALTNTVAGLLILFGIILLEGRTGELNLATIGHSLIGQHARDALAAVSFALVTIGLFTRGALAPLHFWLHEVHAAAPTPLCAVLSGAMAPLALYGFARFYWATYSGVLPPSGILSAAIIAIGIVSAAVGSVMCVREPNLKRMLAFSTVAHAGVVVCGFGSFTAAALAGAGMYVAGYALGAAGLFMAIAIVRRRAKTVDLRRLRGRGRSLPYTAAVFALGTVDVSGLWSSARTAYMPLVIIVGALTGGAFVRATFRIFVQRSAQSPADAERAPWFTIVPASVLVALPIALTVVGDRIGRYAASAAAGLADRAGYEAALVAHGALPAAAAPALPASAAIWLLPVAAAGVAWTATTGMRPVARARVRARYSNAVAFLTGLHGGDSGAYITWIVGAALALGACTVASTAR